MNTFWLKIAGFVLLVFAVLIVINTFRPGRTGPVSNQDDEQPKTYYDVIEQDNKRLRAEVKIPKQAETTESVRSKAGPEKVEFKKLSVEQQVRAEQLFEMAVMERKKARLPMMNYKKMVDYCREITEKFPGSEYDYKARRMLAEVPQQYRNRYNITRDEIEPFK